MTDAAEAIIAANQKDMERAQQEQEEFNNLPDPRQLLTEVSLYTSIKTGNSPFLERLRIKSFQFDTYCVYCRKETTFKTERIQGSMRDPKMWMSPGDFEVRVHCQRARHSYVFFFRYWAGELTKMGQYPSVADVSAQHLSRYRDSLDGGYFSELVRANGLFAHGIGIGSFVYLRRIFESLIDKHYEELSVASGAVDGFQAMRMDERIEVLRDRLPPVLVRRKAAYKILSAGIHALDEEQCKTYYPIVESAILQILEQDFIARQAREFEERLDRQLNAISSEIGSRSTRG